ncbi:hypothetical protein RYX36_009653 [Vicia faba]
MAEDISSPEAFVSPKTIPASSGLENIFTELTTSEYIHPTAKDINQTPEDMSQKDEDIHSAAKILLQ